LKVLKDNPAVKDLHNTKQKVAEYTMSHLEKNLSELQAFSNSKKSVEPEPLPTNLTTKKLSNVDLNLNKKKRMTTVNTKSIFGGLDFRKNPS
jgi:hypothetical protein